MAVSFHSYVAWPVVGVTKSHDDFDVGHGDLVTPKLVSFPVDGRAESHPNTRWQHPLYVCCDRIDWQNEIGKPEQRIIEIRISGGN